MCLVLNILRIAFNCLSYLSLKNEEEKRYLRKKYLQVRSTWRTTRTSTSPRRRWRGSETTPCRSTSPTTRRRRKSPSTGENFPDFLHMVSLIFHCFSLSLYYISFFSSVALTDGNFSLFLVYYVFIHDSWMSVKSFST